MLATAALLALLAVIVLAPIVGTLGERPAAAPSPTATLPATPSPTATPPAEGTHENTTLGYRLTLPEGYRLSRSAVTPGQPEILGHDTYTSRTEAEERADCLQDAGHIPSRTSALYLNVQVYRNVAGRSASDWIRTSRFLPSVSTVEPVSVAGLDAVRLLSRHDGRTEEYVFRANDRIYVLGTDLRPSPIPLDDIATTFRTIPPGPFPTPTPAPAKAPRDAAREVAETLGTAFAARDADAVARTMPDCWIGVWAVVEPVQVGGESCCLFNRSVSLFVEGLRARFASGDLAVRVDPAVQVEVDGGGERYFVRAQWTEPGRTTPIDLFVEERGGGWQWSGARHHYQRSDLEGGVCVKYGSPWVSATASC